MKETPSSGCQQQGNNCLFSLAEAEQWDDLMECLEQCSIDEIQEIHPSCSIKERTILHQVLSSENIPLPVVQKILSRTSQVLVDNKEEDGECHHHSSISVLVTAKDSDGRTPLHVALSNTNLYRTDLIEEVVRANPLAVCESDHMGVRPLDIVSMKVTILEEGARYQNNNNNTTSTSDGDSESDDSSLLESKHQVDRVDIALHPSAGDRKDAILLTESFLREYWETQEKNNCCWKADGWRVLTGSTIETLSDSVLQGHMTSSSELTKLVPEGSSHEVQMALKATEAYLQRYWNAFRDAEAQYRFFPRNLRPLWRTVHVLISACIHLENMDMCQPLLHVCLQGRSDLVPFGLLHRVLARIPLDVPDANGDLPLHVIARFPPPNKKAISLHSIEYQSEDDEDAIERDADVLKYVLSRNPEATRQVNREGKLPLAIAIENGRTLNMGIWKLLRTFPGAIANLNLSPGILPFMLQTLSSNPDVVYNYLQCQPEIFSWSNANEQLQTDQSSNVANVDGIIV